MAQSSSVEVTVRPNPLVVSLDSPPAVAVKKWFDVTAEITNRGDIELTRATVNLLSHKGMSVKGKKEKYQKPACRWDNRSYLESKSKFNREFRDCSRN